MRRTSNIIIIAICGIIGGCAGYGIGHAAGWSKNVDWRVNIGGFPGALLTPPLLHYLLSIGMVVLFVCVAAVVVMGLPTWRVRGVLQTGTPVEATVVRVEKTGEQRRVLGRGGVERQLAVELDVRGEADSPYRARTTQFFTESAQLALHPGARVVVRYDPAKPRWVAIVAGNPNAHDPAEPEWSHLEQTHLS